MYNVDREGGICYECKNKDEKKRKRRKKKEEDFIGQKKVK